MCCYRFSEISAAHTPLGNMRTLTCRWEVRLKCQVKMAKRGCHHLNGFPTRLCLRVAKKLLLKRFGLCKSRVPNRQTTGCRFKRWVEMDFLDTMFWIPSSCYTVHVKVSTCRFLYPVSIPFSNHLKTFVVHYTYKYVSWICGFWEFSRVLPNDLSTEFLKYFNCKIADI